MPGSLMRAPFGTFPEQVSVFCRLACGGNIASIRALNSGLMRSFREAIVFGVSLRPREGIQDAFKIAIENFAAAALDRFGTVANDKNSTDGKKTIRADRAQAEIAEADRAIEETTRRCRRKAAFAIHAVGLGQPVDFT
jgi:hypothetical protein